VQTLCREQREAPRVAGHDFAAGRQLPENIEEFAGQDTVVLTRDELGQTAARDVVGEQPAAENKPEYGADLMRDPVRRVAKPDDRYVVVHEPKRLDQRARGLRFIVILICLIHRLSRFPGRHRAL
jgi:hypothetical protein